VEAICTIPLSAAAAISPATEITDDRDKALWRRRVRGGSWPPPSEERVETDRDTFNLLRLAQ
jgi:hypothetical protein